jgi:hypothetical protein
VPCPYNILGRKTALPWTLYYSGVTRIDLIYLDDVIVSLINRGIDRDLLSSHY